MNKKEIQKIDSFINEVKRLPNQIITDSETVTFLSKDCTDGERKVIYSKQENLFDQIQDIKLRLIAYFRAVINEESTYIQSLTEITFKPKGFIVNTVHYINNEAWLNDKNKLLTLLKMAKTEFEEKARISKENPDKNYLKSKEAKGIILTAVLTLAIGIITKDIWFDNLFHTKENKIEISQIDSLVSADKRVVVEKTTTEVFTNYYQTIDEFENKYAPISALGYLDEYIKLEELTINKKILNKSYIHRFSTNEKLWNESDYIEVAKLIKVKTIDRIKEISEDIENKTQGPFVLTEDKLKYLRESVQKEFSK